MRGGRGGDFGDGDLDEKGLRITCFSLYNVLAASIIESDLLLLLRGIVAGVVVVVHVVLVIFVVAVVVKRGMTLERSNAALLVNYDADNSDS